MRIFAFIVPRMGRYLFAVSAMTSGVINVLRAGNPHLQFDSETSLPLNQHGNNASGYSFGVSLLALDAKTLTKTAVTETSSAPAVALAALLSADTWHRRLGHINPRNVELFRKAEGNGVENSSTTTPSIMTTSMEDGSSFNDNHRCGRSLSCSELPSGQNRQVLVQHTTWGRSTQDGYGIQWRNAID